jgi:sugar phosphate permease
MALTEPLVGDGYKDGDSKFKCWQITVFFVTFVNYAMSHLSRKCYTNVKMDLVKVGVDKNILSQMDMGFMFTYAIGSFVSGRLSDMFPQNVIIGVGLMGSTLCLGLIQYFAYIDLVHYNYNLAFASFFFAQFIHGLFQSTGGPVNTSIVDRWFPKKGRGLTFGLWTCHQYIGDIASGLTTAALINAGFHWMYALLLPGVLNGVWGLVCLFFLPNKPEEVSGVNIPDELKAKPAVQGAAKTGFPFVKALKIPNLMGYSIAFGFFKFINYAMFFWLPFFLSLHFEPQSANVISSLYSVGMMPGGVIVGLVSDLMGGRRACVIAVFMSILAPLLWVFAVFSDVMNPVLLLFLLGLMGILVGGPNNIITSAVAADLAEEAVKLGLAEEKPTGTITGIINGSGSITAAFGLMLIGPLQSLGGWTCVWYFLIFCVVAGTGLMSPKIWKELSE